MTIQQPPKSKVSGLEEAKKKVKLEIPPKISQNLKVKTEELNPAKLSPRRLLLHVKVPVRVENPEKVVQILGG